MGSMQLKDKRVIITGGSRGIGKTVAAQFLREGAQVLIVSRSKEELAETARELAALGSVHTFAADISDSAAVKSIVAEAVKIFGSVHVLVNAAGIYAPIGSSASVDLADWKKTFDINVFGGFSMFDGGPRGVAAQRGAIEAFKRALAGKLVV